MGFFFEVVFVWGFFDVCVFIVFFEVDVLVYFVDFFVFVLRESFVKFEIGVECCSVLFRLREFIGNCVGV